MADKAATTLRFSETERAILEKIQQELGLATIQKTVDYLILQHHTDQSNIKHLTTMRNTYSDRVYDLERKIRDFQDAFKSMMEVKSSMPF
jgi:hypothetical protein